MAKVRKPEKHLLDNAEITKVIKKRNDDKYDVVENAHETYTRAN